MNASPEALTLTNTLLSVIRLQRHLGARIIISTQEPTISPALLDLCSVTIAHRFTSPEWMRSLKNHLAAVASERSDPDLNVEGGESVGAISVKTSNRSPIIFEEIVKLGIGEGLLFAPTAVIALNTKTDGSTKTESLGNGYLKIRVRNRLTDDGGKSVMAT